MVNFAPLCLQALASNTHSATLRQGPPMTDAPEHRLYVSIFIWSSMEMPLKDAVTEASQTYLEITRRIRRDWVTGETITLTEHARLARI